ncbi:YraN family protein [Halopseudomonas nanhaiensis]|uniref:YraN family protein n=1 Tax=Halopseudomonas nanhaiensis TaxID=2830842 RepID=UPI001CBE59F4|nr:YraN family protein [Halopseudomonas nanhaiensis]
MTGLTLRQLLGNRAERAAERLLTDTGMRLLARNYRCKQGELDLVMRDADTVVFVEVRYRRRNQWGSAVETVDWRKQKRLIAAAHHYLLTHPHLADQPCRFDVIAAEGNPADPGSYRWIREAFTC